MSSQKHKAPAYQWYPKDYDTDEAVKLMTYEQEGIYRRLLDHQALHGSIPAEPTEIAMLVPKVTLKRFLALWPRLAKKFSAVGGRLVNQKLERVKADQQAFVSRQSYAGDRSVEARKAKFGTATPANRQMNQSGTESGTDLGTKSGTNVSTSQEVASASASASAESEESASERVMDAFRAGWKRLYGVECSLILKPLEYGDLERQLGACGEARLVQALAAFFATEDPYVRKAKHPLALWLRDPLKYLARDAVVPNRPRGCTHSPACADDSAHTARMMAEKRQVAS